MRQLVLKIDLSVDGFVASSDGNQNWIFGSSGDDYVAWVFDLQKQAGGYVVGSTTALEMASYWPTSTEPLAASMNELPKVIFSKTLKEINWNNSLIFSGDLAEEITRLKQQEGKPLVAFGGARFAQSLAKNHLIDEYRLVTHPVALGNGLPLFSQLTEPLNLHLIEAITFEHGVVAHVYQPA